MVNTLSGIFRAILPFLTEQASYMYKIEDNIEALKSSIVELEAKSRDVRSEVNLQERQGLQPRAEVQLWLSRVETLGSKVCLLLEASEVKLERLCMYGFCFNDFGFTYSEGKIISKELKNVRDLLSSIPRGKEVARRGLPPHTEVRNTRGTVGLEKMLESSWEHLMDVKVGILGLYGMGGVGKTTLLDQIHNKFLGKEDEFFVIYVVVSQDLQIGRLQDVIGKRLGLDHLEWKTKTREEKASDISKVLRRYRFVVLLDDIWKKVDLLDIGIPIPSEENKSKVVFTTRSKVVSGCMGADVEMEVTCLEWENAWKLFAQKVRRTTLESDLKIPELAKIICKKCNGLPLALTVLGETMASKKTEREWLHAINVLNSIAAEEYPGVEEEILKILKILKFSYDDLKDERLKQCFQYCALFPEDHDIDKGALVDYWICEGVLKRGGDRKEIVNEGYEMISKLSNVSLLISCKLEWKVKMHDVVRQMALWAASNFGEHKEIFVVKSGAGLDKMPEVGDWNAVKRISLQNNEIQNISVSPDCSSLETLILRQNKLVNISGKFFLLMPKLLVLDLSENIHLRKLPEEVSMLVSLRYLSLSATKIESLPEGLRELIQLRHLDLTAVQTHPSMSVISSLVNLETLLADLSTFLSLEFLRDIKSLKYLKVLSVSINDTFVLKLLLRTPELASCIEAITLCGIEAKTISFATVMASLKSLTLEECIILDITLEDMRDGYRATRAMQDFKNLGFVKLTNIRGIQDLTCLLFAPSLASLFVSGPSPEMKEIISREKVFGFMNEESSVRPFGKLSTLVLGDLLELKSIYWEPLDFPSLEILIIVQCPNLHKLPLNTESAKSNHIRLYVDNQKWLDNVEWEDEATKARFGLLTEVMEMRKTAD